MWHRPLQSRTNHTHNGNVLWHANHAALNNFKFSSGLLVIFSGIDGWLLLQYSLKATKAHLEAVENKQLILTVINVMFETQYATLNMV